MDYNARYYSPLLGRFISPDPIAPEPTSSSGFNRYRYARNNPLKYTDPSGHCVWDLCILEVAGVTVGIVELSLMAATLYGTYEVVASDVYQDALGGVIEGIPGQAPDVKPSPGYAAGELEFNDPFYQPGPTLGGAYTGPLHLPYPEQVQENSSIFDSFEQPANWPTESAAIREGMFYTHLMQTEFHHSSIRDELIQIIETFLEQPGQEEANQTLFSIYRKFNKELHLLALENIVFKPFIQLITPHYIQSDRQILGLLKNQLMGLAPYWKTYAFKQNLVELLDADFANEYQIVKQLVPMIPSPRLSSEVCQEDYETNRTLLHSLYILCYQQLQPVTLPEFVVSYISHILLTFPNDGGPHFDIDLFPGLPGSSIEVTDEHLRYRLNMDSKEVKNSLASTRHFTILYMDIRLLRCPYIVLNLYFAKYISLNLLETHKEPFGFTTQRNEASFSLYD